MRSTREELPFPEFAILRCMLTFADIEAAAKRVAPYVHRTPILTSEQLNRRIGHNLFFKAECFQKVGAFKARGAINTLRWLQESGSLPPRVIAYSSGNHAQAVAWAATLFGVPSLVFMPTTVSKVKAAATAAYGAEVVLTDSRPEAEARARKEVAAGGLLIPPYDHDQVICGQGTACLEALEQIPVAVDAIFAPCGGGGLVSGTWLAARGRSPSAKVFAAEPEIANDAARSYRSGQIFRWEASPPTVADGVRTLAVSERTFAYIRQLDGFFEIGEPDILEYTRWLCHFLKAHCEPTAALGLAAAAQWARTQSSAKNVLVILSGGNADAEVIRKVWAEPIAG